MTPTFGPLSVVTYYLRNKRRVVPLLLILGLAVALMMVVQSLVGSARDTAYAIFGSYQGVEVVAPRVQSQVDAYKPIVEALAALQQDRNQVDASGLPGSDAFAGLAALFADLQRLPSRLKASAPSTVPLQAELTSTAGDGARLEADLRQLSADLKTASRQQSEQSQIAILAGQMQKNPTDPSPLNAYLARPHDFTALARPDTTDYQALQDDANRAAGDTGTLVADLQAVRAGAQALASTPLPELPTLLPHSAPKLPQAGAALAGLASQLDSLQARLGQLTAPQGNIDELEAAAKKLPGVARVERDTYANIDLNMLAGNANFDLYGLDRKGMEAMLSLYGDRLVRGRLPSDSAAEVVISEEVARSRGITIGGFVGSDIDELDSLPEHFKVVGLLAGPTRLGFIPRQYMISNYFFSRRYQALLVIPDRAGPAAFRDKLHQLIDKKPYRIFDGPFVTDKIDSLLVNLSRINDFLTLVVGLTLALVIGLLNNLYFRQRMNEFGLLAAIGYPRRRLIRRVGLEGALVVAAAWIVGGAIGVAVLAGFNAIYIVPHGLVLRVFDPGILLRSTLPVPVMVLLVSQATLLLQLSRLDPISIIERRD
ncbi:MAG: ABC transporter permease [Candidatus Dormibacteria bacterium]